MRARRAGRVCCIVGIAASSLAAGCHRHVVLEAPKPEAPEADRVEAYAKLKPLSYHETKTTTVGTFSTTTEREIDYLQLASGMRVYYPEDLLPVVPPDSPTAVAASESESGRKLEAGLEYGGAAAMTLGAVIALIGFLNSDADGLQTTPILIGAGITVGGAGMLWGGQFVGNSAADDAATAYETYDDSLRRRMNLCVEGDLIHDCPTRGKELGRLLR